MTDQILIEARGLSRRYGPTVAVDGLDLTLKQGEILGLLGPNGAGKTTTMKMLAGCLAPSAGSIRINGVDLREEPLAAKRHLGYLPEQPPVYPELTVEVTVQM
jgi:ABC-2 type transport system ATP-binding protein